MTDFWTATLTFAQTITEQVGDKLLADFGQVQASSEKADGSLVTQSESMGRSNTARRDRHSISRSWCFK